MSNGKTEFESLYPDIEWEGIIGHCGVCGDIIISIYSDKPAFHHDMEMCSCKNTMIDNGGEYCRFGGTVLCYNTVTKNSKFNILVDDKIIIENLSVSELIKQFPEEYKKYDKCHRVSFEIVKNDSDVKPDKKKSKTK